MSHYFSETSLAELLIKRSEKVREKYYECYLTFLNLNLMNKFLNSYSKKSREEEFVSLGEISTTTFTLQNFKEIFPYVHFS